MALQEVAAEDVEACRSGGQARSGGEPATSSAPADASQGPPAEAAALAAADTAIAPAQAAVAAGDAANTLAALEWATGLKDEALLAGLAASLPTAVREEQVRLYEASLSIAAEGPTKVQKLLVHPHLLKSRMQVAAAFHDYLADSGWTFSRAHSCFGHRYMVRTDRVRTDRELVRDREARREKRCLKRASQR